MVTHLGTLVAVQPKEGTATKPVRQAASLLLLLNAEMKD